MTQILMGRKKCRINLNKILIMQQNVIKTILKNRIKINYEIKSRMKKRNAKAFFLILLEAAHEFLIPSDYGLKKNIDNIKIAVL